MNYEIGDNTEDLSEYLKETDCIDFSNPLVAQKTQATCSKTKQASAGQNHVCLPRFSAQTIFLLESATSI